MYNINTMLAKVKYIGGAGIVLKHPLTDGQKNFFSGIEYTITDPKDISRLKNSPKFEVTINKPVTTTNTKEYKPVSNFDKKNTEEKNSIINKEESKPE